MKAPVSRTDARRLFHYIASDFKVSSDLTQSDKQVSVTISKLYKVMDHINEQKQRVPTIAVSEKVIKPLYSDAAMKPDDLGQDRATIQYSEAPTYGGCDNVSSEYHEVIVKQNEHVASRFDAQQSQNDLGTKSQMANSIIQLENHLKKNDTKPTVPDEVDKSKVSKVEQLK